MAHRKFNMLPEEVRRVIRLCDGFRTFDEVCQESAVPRFQTALILLKLMETGFVNQPDCDFNSELWSDPYRRAQSEFPALKD